MNSAGKMLTGCEKAYHVQNAFWHALYYVEHAYGMANRK